MRKITGAKSFFTNPITGVEDAIWTFIPEDFVFIDPLNPWPFETRRYFSSPSPSIDQDFVGVKLGDVNNSWNPANLKPTAPVDSFYFVMDHAIKQPGSNLDHPRESTRIQ